MKEKIFKGRCVNHEIEIKITIPDAMLKEGGEDIFEKILSMNIFKGREGDVPVLIFVP